MKVQTLVIRAGVVLSLWGLMACSSHKPAPREVVNPYQESLARKADLQARLADADSSTRDSLQRLIAFEDTKLATLQATQGYSTPDSVLIQTRYEESRKDAETQRSLGRPVQPTLNP